MNETCLQCESPVLSVYDRLCPACQEGTKRPVEDSHFLDDFDLLEENLDSDIDLE